MAENVPHELCHDQINTSSVPEVSYDQGQPNDQGQLHAARDHLIPLQRCLEKNRGNALKGELYTKLCQHIETSVEVLAKFKDDIEKMSSELNYLKEDIDARNKKKDELEKEKNEWENDKKNWKITLDNTLEDNETLRESESNLKKKLDLMKEEMHKLDKDKTKVVKERDKLKAKCDDFRNEVDVLKKKCQSLEKQGGNQSKRSWFGRINSLSTIGQLPLEPTLWKEVWVPQKFHAKEQHQSLLKTFLGKCKYDVNMLTFKDEDKIAECAVINNDWPAKTDEDRLTADVTDVKATEFTKKDSNHTETIKTEEKDQVAEVTDRAEEGKTTQDKEAEEEDPAAGAIKEDSKVSESLNNEEEGKVPEATKTDEESKALEVTKTENESKATEAMTTEKENKCPEAMKTKEDGKAPEAMMTDEENQPFDAMKTKEEGKTPEAMTTEEEDKAPEATKTEAERKTTEVMMTDEERKAPVAMETKEENKVPGVTKTEEEDKDSETMKTEKESKASEATKTEEEEKVPKAIKTEEEAKAPEAMKTEEEDKKTTADIVKKDKKAAPQIDGGKNENHSVDNATLETKDHPIVLIPCVVASRMGSDLGATFEDAGLDRAMEYPNAIVIIFMPKAPHVAENVVTTFAKMGNEFKVRDMVDVVFWDNDFYQCKTNNAAVAQMKAILGLTKNETENQRTSKRWWQFGKCKAENEDSVVTK